MEHTNLNAPDENLMKRKKRDRLVRMTINKLCRDRLYKLEKLLGNGTYGDVVQVFDPFRRKSLAVKIVVGDNVSQLELDLWPGLKHPHVVPLLDVVCYQFDELSVSFLMPLQMRTMQDVMEDKAFCHHIYCMNYMKMWLHQVLQGINYMHLKQICHLDIKIDNVLITSSFFAVISDFSFINVTTQRLRRYDLGLPYIYRPPEACQTLGEQISVDGPAYDMWGYGMMVLECITSSGIAEVVSNCDCWIVQVYPLLFGMLQKDLIKSVFFSSLPGAAFKEQDIEMAHDFVHMFLRCDPRRRATADLGLLHAFLEKGKYLHGVVDDLWTQNMKEKLYNYCSRSQQEYEELEGSEDSFSSSTEEELERLRTSNAIEGNNANAEVVPSEKVIMSLANEHCKAGTCFDRILKDLLDADDICQSDAEKDLLVKSWWDANYDVLEIIKSRWGRGNKLNQISPKELKDLEGTFFDANSRPVHGETSSVDHKEKPDHTLRRKQPRYSKIPVAINKLKNVPGIMKDAESKVYVDRVKLTSSRKLFRRARSYRRFRSRSYQILRRRGKSTRKHQHNTKKWWKSRSSNSSSIQDTFSHDSEGGFSGRQHSKSKRSRKLDRQVENQRCREIRETLYLSTSVSGTDSNNSSRQKPEISLRATSKRRISKFVLSSKVTESKAPSSFIYETSSESNNSWISENGNRTKNHASEHSNAHKNPFEVDDCLTKTDAKTIKDYGSSSRDSRHLAESDNDELLTRNEKPSTSRIDKTDTSPQYLACDKESYTSCSTKSLLSTPDGCNPINNSNIQENSSKSNRVTYSNDSFCSADNTESTLEDSVLCCQGLYSESGEFQPMLSIDSAGAKGDSLQEGDSSNQHRHQQQLTNFPSEGCSSTNKAETLTGCIYPPCRSSKSKLLAYVKTLKKQTKDLNQVVKKLEENIVCENCWNLDKVQSPQSTDSTSADETNSNSTYTCLEKSLRNNIEQESDFDDDYSFSSSFTCDIEYHDTVTDIEITDIEITDLELQPNDPEELRKREKYSGEETSDDNSVDLSRRPRRVRKWFRDQYAKLEMVVKCWSYKLLK